MSQAQTLFQDDIHHNDDEDNQPACPFCGDRSGECAHLFAAIERTSPELCGGYLFGPRDEELQARIRAAVVAQKQSGRVLPPSSVPYLSDLVASSVCELEEEAAVDPDWVPIDADIYYDYLGARLQDLPDIQFDRQDTDSAWGMSWILLLYWSADPAATYAAIERETDRLLRIVTSGGVATVVESREDLAAALARTPEQKRDGAAVFAPTTWSQLVHVGLFGVGTFAPDGPTLQTVSVSAFGSLWPMDTPILTRRILHPHGDHYAQVLGSVHEPGYTVLEFAAKFASFFVMNNAVTGASVDWARRLCPHIPNLITFTTAGSGLQAAVRAAFGWLLQDAEKELSTEIAVIEQQGPQFERCTPSFRFPDPALYSALESFTPSVVFERWWDLVTAPSYRNALYKQLGACWYRAKNALGTVIPEDDGTPNADFDRVWIEFGNRRTGK